MKASTRAPLLSLLIFPGIGHLVLKKYWLALAFIISSLYLLFGLVNKVNALSQQIVERINKGEISMELSAIHNALIKSDVLHDPNFSMFGYLLIIVWLVSAFDSYRIAKKQEKTKSNEPT